MVSRVAVSWDVKVKDMAIKLGVMLNTEGKKEREEWDKLHGMLGRIAGYLSIADRSMSTQALLLKLKEKIGPRNQGESNIEGLLQKIVAIVEERIEAENADASRAIHLFKDLIMLLAGELDMFPLCDSIHTEMIQEYTFYGDKVKHIVDELSASAPYTVLSIVGAQSSGKSYLLNQLFGTDFPVMDAKTGRKQTTRGILISRCIRPSMLVLDVEGFDGRERGQDTRFERQAALFALTVSDIMIVNMSMHDIGREDGGGTTLFKIIFQERRKLSPGLTTIIVVLRHYDDETPVVLLEDIIMKDLKKMWKSVDVNSMEKYIFKEYIQVKVVALQEFKLPIFREEVRNLRKLLSDSSFERNISARVPAPSFSKSSELLWGEIKINKRLDLPSHKVMISTVYCQQIVDDSIKYFSAHKDYKLLRTLESPKGFKHASDNLLKSSMDKYDQDTDMYDVAIRETKRQKLKREINKILKTYSQELILKIREKMSEQFRSEFVTNLKTKEESDDLVKYQKKILQDYRENFIKFCEDLKSFDVDYFHKICLDLQDELQQFTSYKIMGVKEERARKEVDSASQRSDKKVQEVLEKLEAMRLEEKRMKEEMDRDREEQRSLFMRVREDAAREHQKLVEEQEEDKKILRQEVQKREQIIKELEEKQKKQGEGCTIL